MTEPKKPPTLSRPRQLPKALKGPAHRDRRRAKPTKVYDLDVPGDQARRCRRSDGSAGRKWTDAPASRGGMTSTSLTS